MKLGLLLKDILFRRAICVHVVVLFVIKKKLCYVLANVSLNCTFKNQNVSPSFNLRIVSVEKRYQMWVSFISVCFQVRILFSLMSCRTFKSTCMLDNLQKHQEKDRSLRLLLMDETSLDARRLCANLR